VAFSFEIPKEGLLFYLILNAYWESLDFELPSVENGEPWRRWIDTTLDPPEDIVEWQTALPVSGKTYRAGPRSIVALFARGWNH
jgi:glycogen operon protein